MTTTFIITNVLSVSCTRRVCVKTNSSKRNRAFHRKMRSFISFGLLVLAATANCASIDNTNLVYDAPRLHTGEALVGDVVNDCLVAAETMSCLKGKVLTYLDTQLNINEEQGRSMSDGKDVDEIIYERAGRLLANQRFQIPLIGGAQLSYSPDQGLDIDLPTEEGIHRYSISLYFLLNKCPFFFFFFYLQPVVIC